MRQFNPLDYPVGLLYPARVALSAWTEHVPFAMTLIDILRPRVVVELGAYYGVSYCAFCQAIAHLGLGTRAYAVDTWKGDPHAGFNGPEILEDLRVHHDPRYSGFSRLIQATFDEALAHFGDGSIDLLHIDGYHTYEAVRHDFENWLPKMSDRGVILFHDTNVRQKDFGVWRFWEEVRARYPAFEFLHHHGLGVLAVGSQCPERLQPLLAASADEAAQIREYFFQLGRRISCRWEAEQRLKALAAEAADKERLAAEVSAMHASLAEQGTWLAEAERRITETERQLAETDQARRNCLVQLEEKENHIRHCHADMTKQVQIIEEQRARLAECDARIRELQTRFQQLQEEAAAMQSSLSWRCARQVSAVVRKLAPPGSWRRGTLNLGRRGLGFVARKGVVPALGVFRRGRNHGPAAAGTQLPPPATRAA